MTDDLLEFLTSRDPVRVERERVRVSLSQLLAEANPAQREVIESMPIGVLRRKLLEFERRVLQPVRVVGDPELVQALRKSNAERDELRRRNAELRGIVEGRAA